jgi:hypothetical protein
MKLKDFVPVFNENPNFNSNIELLIAVIYYSITDFIKQNVPLSEQFNTRNKHLLKVIKEKAKKKPFFITDDKGIQKNLLRFKENREEILIPPFR